MNARELTGQAKAALSLAHEAATALGHGYVGSEHMLLGLMREKDGVAARALKAGGVEEEVFLKRLTDTVGRGEPGQTLLQGLTPRGKHIVNIAASEAARLGHSMIGTEHLLLGILHDGESMAAQILTSLGVDSRKLYAGIVDNIYLQPLPPGSRLPGRTSGASPSVRELPKTLARFGRDLTAAAAMRKLDPVVGRGEEILRVMQILSRRQKNNPVLLGEPGVGKTAVVEGLAQRIVSGDVPPDLEGIRVLTLDLSAMVAGTKYRGEFEERFKQVMEETTQTGGILLFIDEMHMLVGAGAAEGAIDAANILKPALARGEVRMIGATTLEEYRRHVERDAALERRFQPVTVGEPSAEETERILQGLRPRYEAHHQVEITDEAISAAVALSTRYIADRFLPDKALDLIDEACARRRMERLGTPESVRKAETALEHASGEKEAALRRNDIGAASDSRVKELKARAALTATLDDWKETNHAEPETIGPDDIAAVVAGWTGIPVARLTQGESERLLAMEELLRRRVIGQENAAEAVTRAVRRGRLGLKDPKRPIGSFIFLGPSGVGKTELCRALAEIQFGREEALIRVDMSELMERHSTATLIGAPPGYVGYGEGGGLTEKIRRRPYSVVLFDEIEKAHPDVLSLLLQVLEDGRLTDGAGRRVDFRNTIIVMTSNLGAKALAGRAALGFGGGDVQTGGDEVLALEEVRHVLPPEFLSRVDDVIVFRPLSVEQTEKVARLMLEPVRERLAARGVALDITDEAVRLLAKRGCDTQQGVRPLRRIIRAEIEDALSEKLLAGSVPERVMVMVRDGRLQVGED